MTDENACRISNPILKGFNPDPSIVCVGEDYYIATSTFEWFPGVQIHHSKDLVNWQLLTRPLDDTRLLDMNGVPNSGGVWAPCLTWADGRFWLFYTIVHELNSITKDTPNYLTTAEDINGPWSDPVYINSSGFDPSLFHDDDGRKWVLNMVWDHRPGKHPFYGIDLQEYDPTQGKLIGRPVNIFKGTKLGCTEGPHLYKREGWYYLLTAEGGTGYEHAVTLARSRNIEGPYEVHPENPIVTSWQKDELYLQKAGHADIVETPSGDWYLVHLCSRPLKDTKRCVLGRETAIQKVEWRDDGWLYLCEGGNDPQERVLAPDLPEVKWPATPARDDFDGETLCVDFQTLRIPLSDDVCSLSARPGYLRLAGGESLQSKFGQTLVARRQQAFSCTALTSLEFEPETFQNMAGLVCFYNTNLYHYLCMSIDEKVGTCLYIQSCDDGEVKYPLGDKVIPLNGSEKVYLKVIIKYDELQFFYSLDGEQWKVVGDTLDASILSDDYGRDWGFTGVFIGMACQDLTGQRKIADFDFFEYQEHR